MTNENNEKANAGEDKLAQTRSVNSLSTSTEESENVSNSGERVQKVMLTSSIPPATDDQALWSAIRDRTNAIGFDPYSRFINRLLCNDGEDTTQNGSGLSEVKEKKAGLMRKPSIYGVDSYQLLKLATQAFLTLETGVLLEDGGSDKEETRRLGRPVTIEKIKMELEEYLGGQNSAALPYLKKIVDTLVSDTAMDQRLPYCEQLLRNRFSHPSMIELIWSYWQEEGMLVQTLNAISHRFQNRRSGAADPLINLELDPIRPLNNLLWGFIQDARSSTSLGIDQRSHEYLHHYGISLYGKAVPRQNPADKRSTFIPAFHTMLQRAAEYYHQDSDTTVRANAFPLMQAIKDVHLILAEGAHNQFGDLPWTARSEMLMMQWLLARPELREFLRGRHMVPYTETWMGTVDTMKRVQSWSDDTITHFRDLAVFGEQVVLSVRWGNWSAVNNEDHAKNWANYWKSEVQSYIHSYHAVTGVELRTDTSNQQQIQARNMQPSAHLQKRLAAQHRPKQSSFPPSSSARKAIASEMEDQAEWISPPQRHRLPRYRNDE